MVGRADPPGPETTGIPPEKELYRLKSADPAVRLEHRLRQGSPAAEILRTADEDRCDLIVMGMHGRTGLDRVRMGSVVEEVLRLAAARSLP